MSFSLFFVQFIDIDYRFYAIASLTLLTALLTLWSLREALGGIRWGTTIILPSFFTASIALFYFLLPPSAWLSRLPIVLFFAIGLYALFLTENIFSVAAIRTIQLFRAASAVGFLLTLVTCFLLFDTIFSFRLSYFFNSVLVFAVSLPLIFQALWSVNLEEKLTRPLLISTLFLPLSLAQVALIISFYPLTTAISSLLLTTCTYVLIGLSQASFAQRLFRQTVYEYLAVVSIVLFIILVTTRWGG